MHITAQRYTTLLQSDYVLFLVTAAQVWNSLPPQTTAASSLVTRRKKQV